MSNIRQLYMWSIVSIFFRKFPHMGNHKLSQIKCCLFKFVMWMRYYFRTWILLLSGTVEHTNCQLVQEQPTVPFTRLRCSNRTQTNVFGRSIYIYYSCRLTPGSSRSERPARARRWHIFSSWVATSSWTPGIRPSGIMRVLESERQTWLPYRRGARSLPTVGLMMPRSLPWLHLHLHRSPYLVLKTFCRIDIPERTTHPSRHTWTCWITKRC